MSNPISCRAWTIAIGAALAAGLMLQAGGRLGGAAGVALAGPPFAPAHQITVGEAPRTAATGDFDEDGDTDLVVLNYLGASLSILLGHGTGDFAAPTTLANNTGPWDVALGDFNEDEHLDIAVVNKVSDDVSIFAGNGDGSFGSQQAFDTTAQRPVGIAAGDFNEDTHLDVAVCSDVGDHVEIFIGDGSGALTSTGVTPIGDEPRSLDAADLDHDGHLDVVSANASSNDVSILLGDGAGGFVSMPSVAVASAPSVVRIGHLDDDSHRDVATGNFGNSTVTVVFGNGDGTFGNRSDHATGRDPLGFAILDLNGDHELDLLTANSRGDDVSALLGDGAGGFADHIPQAVGSGPQGIGTGDFDRNGVTDAVVADWGSNDVAVLVSLADPAAVEMASLVAEALADGVWLRWATRSETDHAGFIVERAPTGEAGVPGSYRRLNAALVHPPGPYAYHDPTVEPGRDYVYRLIAVDRFGGREVAGRVTVAVPRAASAIVASVSPSPGRAPIALRFHLAAGGEVLAAVYDSNGRLGRVLYSGTLAAGDHELAWDGEHAQGPAPAGVYFMRLHTRAGDAIRKAILVR